MDRIGTLLAVCLILLVGLSCAGSSDGPLSPDMNQRADITTGQVTSTNQSNTHLWGIWEIRIDPDTVTAEIIPLRGVSYTCNINEFIDGPPSNLLLKDMVVIDGAGYTDITLDVGLRHPFPGLDTYTGFDLLGVFLGMGSQIYPGTIPLPVASENDQRLLNPDGYTRWFNRPEFKTAGEILNLFGYDPGAAGTPAFYPTAYLNGFKYFTDGLSEEGDVFEFLADNPDQRGSFKPGKINFRSYELRFPDSLGISFQYAVIAHWEEHDNYPNNPNSLDDFPLSANADEAIALSTVSESNLFYTSGNSGGDVILNITPWDWSAETNVSSVMEEYEIKCFSRAWTGAYDVDMTPVAENDHYYTFHAEIHVDSLSSPEPLPVWIEIGYPKLDYSNPFGIENDADGALTAYFLVHIPVTTELPYWIDVQSPNGGEVWYPGDDEEITWTEKDVTGTVYIEYSKDNFASDIHTIATDEINDGSYMWTNIPDDPSSTVRVRITSTDDPSTWDRSDANFTIFGAWIEVTAPNGGEEWEPGTNHSITWLSDNIPGTVFIEYSKDNFVSDINPISSDEANDGNFTWFNIPYDPSSTVRVRISSTDDPLINDTSDADFTITTLSNWIQVGSPNGGEKWMVGSDYEVTWTSEYVTGTVFIEYSKDAFVSDIHTIATGETNDGSYVWSNIPSDLSNTVRVRVSSTDTPTVNDMSDNDFSIVSTAGWVQTWGGTSDDSGTSVALDSSGSYYITGTFKDTVDFDPGGGVVNKTATGAKDCFLSKFNSSGTFQWVLTWGGIGDDLATGLALDNLGGIYVTGSFYDTVDFDPGSGTQNQNSHGGTDAFLNKLDSSGTFQWVRTWGGISADQGLAVASTAAGNVYVTGSYMETVDFDTGSGSDSHTSTNSPDGHSTSDVFVSAFNSAGVYTWGQVWGGNFTEFGQAVAVDGSGYVCVAGWFQSTVDFNPTAGTDNRTSNGAGDIFISRYSSAGTYQWARAWGGTGNDAAFGITMDATGNIFVTGKYESTVDFDPGGATDNHTSNGLSDAFLSRFTSAGALTWALTWGDTGQEAGYGIALDASTNIGISGQFEDTVDFDPGAGTTDLTSNGAVDGFMSLFSSAGAFQWARSWGGINSESAKSLGFDNSDNCYITGSFKATVDFAPTDPPCNNSSDERTSNGKTDAYLLKYLATGCW